MMIYSNHLLIFRSKARQESDVLKSYLKKAQDDIVVLLDEKRKLLDTVRNLQVNLKQKIILREEKIQQILLTVYFFRFLQQQIVSKDRNLKNDGNR